MRKITSSEIKNNLFYQLPKFLLLDNRFRKMSNDSKILYSLYFDRSKLSIKNKWIDKDGNVYIFFTNKKAMELLNCRSEKLNKIKNELNKYGLIQEVQRGVRKANKIYVLVCNDSIIDIDEFEEIKENLNEKVKNYEINESNLSCSKIEYVNSKIEHNEIRKSNTSNTNISNTNINKNNTSENNSDENEKPIEEEKKVFDKESAEYKMATYLYKKLQKLNPNHKNPDFQKWAKEADYLIRLDKRHDLYEIKDIIDWTFDNAFWKSKVLSISGLRKHYDTLFIQMNNDKSKNNTVVNMNDRKSNNNNDTAKEDARDNYIKENSRKFLEQYRNKVSK